MSSPSFPSDPLPSLGDSWRRLREAISFTSVRVRADTATHVFRVGRYSRVDGKVSPGECVESEFRAGGRKWKLLYYPNGDGADKVKQLGKVCTRLKLMGNWRTRATAEYRVSILDADGKPAHGRAVGARSYSGLEMFEEFDYVDVVATAKEQTSALRRGEEDSLVIRCDVTVLNIHEESRIRYFLRQLWN